MAGVLRLQNHACARLIQSTALHTAEAALTGESLPVAKDVAPIPEMAGLGDRRNMVFAGGVHAAATGIRPRRETSWGIVVVIAVVVIAVILLVEDVTGFAVVFDVLILGVALAVAAVPEGLPAVVTTVLAVRRATNGEEERDRASSHGSEDSGLGERHRLRQDRHPDDLRVYQPALDEPIRFVRTPRVRLGHFVEKVFKTIA